MEDCKNANEDGKKSDVHEDDSCGIVSQSKSTASVALEKKSRKRSRSDSPVSPKKLLSFISPASSFLAQVKSSPEKKAKSKKSEKTKKNKSKRRESKKSKRSRTESRTAAQNATEHNRPVTPKDTPPASPPSEPEPPSGKAETKRSLLNETTVAVPDRKVQATIAFSPLGQTPPELKSSPSSPESDSKPIPSGASFPPSFKVTGSVADLLFASREKRPPKKSGSDIPALEYEQLRKQFARKILEVFRSSKPHSKSRIVALAELGTKKAYLYKSTEKIIAKQMDKVIDGNFEGIVACLYLVDAIVSQAKKKYGKNKEKFSSRLLSTVMQHLNRIMEMQLPISLSMKASDLIAEKTVELQRIKKEALRLVNNWMEKKAFRDTERQLLNFRKKWQPQFPAIRTEKFHPSLSGKTKKLRLIIPKELEVTESPPSPPRSLSPVVLPPPPPVVKPPALAVVRPPPAAGVWSPALPPAAPAVSKPSPTVSSVMAVMNSPMGNGILPAPPPPPPKNPPSAEVDSLESRVRALSQANGSMFSFLPGLHALGIASSVRPSGPLLSVPPPPNGFLQPLPSLPLPVYSNFLLNGVGPTAGLLPLPVNVDNSQISKPNIGFVEDFCAFYNAIGPPAGSAPKADKEEIRHVPLNVGGKPPNSSVVPQAPTVNPVANHTVNPKPQEQRSTPAPVPKPQEQRNTLSPVGTETDWRRWCGFAPKPRNGYYSVVTRMLHVRVLPKDREADHNKRIISNIFSEVVFGRVEVTVDPLNNFAVITMENRARAFMAKRDVLGTYDSSRGKPSDERWDSRLDTEERFTLNAIRSGRMQLDWYPGDHIKKNFSQFWEVSPYGCAYIPWTTCFSLTSQNRASQKFDPEKFRQFAHSILAGSVAAVLPDSLINQPEERMIYADLLNTHEYFLWHIFPDKRSARH